MAKFVILIYGDAQQWAAMSEEQQRKQDAAHAAFNAAGGAKILGGVALASQLPEVHAGHSGVEIRPVVDHG
jgi:hypothetical protein